MSRSVVHPLIIIGSGPAGLTAGIYAGRAKLNPIILDGSTPGGQLMGTSMVENWPGSTRIMGPELMINMRKQAVECGAQIISGTVVKAELTQGAPFRLWTDKGQELLCSSLIIATGATPKRLGSPGEDKYWGKGVTTCAVCDGAFYQGKKVIIVGGGDTAMEDASFMTKFTDDITVVHILDRLTASAAMQERVVQDPKIKIIYSSTLTEIKGDGSRVTAAVIQNTQTKETQEMAVDGIFVAIGLTPNTAPFKGQLAMNHYGYITVTNETATSIKGVFAAGDVTDDKYRQAITSAGSGCKAALDAERFLKTV